MPYFDLGQPVARARKNYVSGKTLKKDKFLMTVFVNNDGDTINDGYQPLGAPVKD